MKRIIATGACALALLAGAATTSTPDAEASITAGAAARYMRHVEPSTCNTIRELTSGIGYGPAEYLFVQIYNREGLNHEPGFPSGRAVFRALVRQCGA